ncbi:MerR family transcriptional regulator [Ectobacillus sp. JY-23]|uniref:MerR family transcriptional regulator n=1 Tax=Ectobacillus sp. JY-23 TaxID=2933872 RepID=UPI001FF2525D|nr:MerR family transcriptional regulator [Ectobacillus sp. JY-23]UOY93339.1 MerR family transcriptional regulator [Ectobacillus sp. JY-23]
MYTIGEVAHMLGLTAHTLRYYEKEKIIVPERSENGERVYQDTHVAWLRFVMKLKQTQMPLARIREYAQLFSEGERTAELRLQLLEDHYNSIKQQMETLQETERILAHKIASYKMMLESEKREAT